MTADDMRQYVNHMKHEGVFGDGIMLSAAAMLHGRPVVVFAAEGPSSVQHVDLSADAQVLGPPIYLGLYCKHYVSVKPLRVSEVESPLPTDVFRDSSHLNPRKHLQDFASVTEPMLVDQTQTQCDVGIYAAATSMIISNANYYKIIGRRLKDLNSHFPLITKRGASRNGT